MTLVISCDQIRFCSKPVPSREQFLSSSSISHPRQPLLFVPSSAVTGVSVAGLPAPFERTKLVTVVSWLNGVQICSDVFSNVQQVGVTGNDDACRAV